MTKSELIAYLDAVCDAESAVQACEDAIKLHKSQQNALYLPIEPSKPIYTIPSKSKTKLSISEYLAFSAVLIIPVILLLRFLLVSLHIVPDDAVTTSSLLLPAGIITLVGIPLAFHAADNSDFQKEKANAQKENQLLDSEYSSKLVVYQQQSAVHQAASASLRTSIQQQETLKSRALTQLNKLYTQNHLYLSFRNLIAAYQIREYLQMGICDTLEGPTGAYAQYMNDVRTARICDSITDLKRSLTTAINGLQGTLARELQQLDNNLDGIRNDMNTSVQRLNAQMQQLHSASAAQLDARFNEANRHLSDIKNSLAISEHNRYIERRLNNVDTYLMKLP